MDGFLEEGTFEQSFKDITKRKMKGWCREIVDCSRYRGEKN